MGEYRNRTTGEVKSQGAWRQDFPNMSLPRVWKSATLDALDLDPIMTSAKPSTTALQIAVRDGVVQTDGVWMENYVVQDMFTDITDDNGNVTKTKAEQETEYQAVLDERTATSNRATRDSKLAETDFYALSDVTMTDEMATYRQALRDITSHDNWPNLEEADWPVKP